MKPKNHIQIRQHCAEQALANVRLEGLEPSKWLYADIEKYISGKLDTNHILKNILKTHNFH